MRKYILIGLCIALFVSFAIWINPANAQTKVPVHTAPVTVPVKTPTFTVIHIGDKNDRVLQVQYALRSFGYSVQVDGIFGSQTEKAVKKFQAGNGLPQDGIVGEKTFSRINVALGPRAIKDPPVVIRQVRKIAPSTPIAQPDPTPQVTSSDGSWHDEAMSVGWTEDQWSVLSCIINRESRGNPSAKNRHSSATGLLQILASGFPGVNLYDPITNLRVGLQMFGSRGWRPWNLPGHQCS